MAAKTVRKVDPDLQKRSIDELVAMLGKKATKSSGLNRDRLLRKVMRLRRKKLQEDRFSKKWLETLGRR